jgi:hypothetical protein
MGVVGNVDISMYCIGASQMDVERARELILANGGHLDWAGSDATQLRIIARVCVCVCEREIFFICHSLLLLVLGVVGALVWPAKGWAEWKGAGWSVGTLLQV